MTQFSDSDRIACLKRVIRVLSGREQVTTDTDIEILEAMIVSLGGNTRIPGVSDERHDD